MVIITPANKEFRLFQNSQSQEKLNRAKVLIGDNDVVRYSIKIGVIEGMALGQGANLGIRCAIVGQFERLFRKLLALIRLISYSLVGCCWGC